MALAPISSSERVAVVDVLRGLALYGVLTANLVWFYSGLEMLPPKGGQGMSLAGFYMGLFVSERAITTLTFLFGLGFSVQLARADARGENVRGVFVRRLLAMLMFGVAHILLLWWGDILWTYALVGFSLLWFRRYGVRALLAWAAILIFVPRLVVSVPEVRDAIMSVMPRPADEAAFNAEMLAALASGDRGAMTWAHLQKVVYMESSIAAWFWPWVLGHFLLGMAAGKARLFERDGAERRRLFRWLLAIGIALVVIAIAVLMTVPLGREAFRTMPLIAKLGLSMLRQLVTLGVVAIYVSAVVLLMQRQLPRRLLLLIAPVGRMPLTTYLSQSLIATFVFYGWGLGWIGEVDMADGVAIAAGIFAVQVVIANLWLRRFRSGPLEQLWRAITYRAPRAAPVAGETAGGTSEARTAA
ncbi:MAG TPA: DUF418 domain-containing protein [Kofleriaceae bacterium]|nr:DUF418 domain-containing protein [Kofleriaceae bacterium]